MGVFTVLNVLRQNHESLLTLLRANKHDDVNDGLTEQHVRVILQAVKEELEEDVGLLRDSLIELAHRLDRLDFELDTKVRQIGTNLLQKLLDLVFIACFE